MKIEIIPCILIQKKVKSLDSLYVENWSDIYFTGFKITITHFLNTYI